MPLSHLWQPSLGSSPPSCTEKIWEFWYPGVTRGSQVPGMKLVLKPPHQNKDHNSSSTPKLSRDDKSSNCATSYQPLEMSHVFTKSCLAVIIDFSSQNQNKPKKTKKPWKTYHQNKTPKENKKWKNTELLHLQKWRFLSDSNSSNGTGVDVSTPEDQMHDITHREQVLCKTFVFCICKRYHWGKDTITD